MVYNAQTYAMQSWDESLSQRSMRLRSPAKNPSKIRSHFDSYSPAARVPVQPKPAPRIIEKQSPSRVQKYPVTGLFCAAYDFMKGNPNYLEPESRKEGDFGTTFFYTAYQLTSVGLASGLASVGLIKCLF